MRTYYIYIYNIHIYVICNTYTFVVTLQKNMQVTSLPNIQHHTSLPRRLKMWALHGLPGSRSPGGWRLNTFPVFWPNRFRSRRRKKEDKPSRRWQDKQVGPQPLTACDSEDEEIDNIVFFVLFRQHLLCASLLHTVQNIQSI